MLSTFELEKVIREKINNVLPKEELEKINFSEGLDNSPEGIYVFTKNNKYHYVFTEKGKIREHKVLDNVAEILWNVLDTILFDISMDYAIKNREQGMDFRRLLFEKEVQLYAQFGQEFEQRKKLEIVEILKKNPYNDVR